MNEIVKHEPLPLPDPRRPVRTVSFPQWTERCIGAVRPEIQLSVDGMTFENNALTLPANLIPNAVQRLEMENYVASVASLLAQTPEADASFESRTAVVVSKLMVVLAGERKSDIAEEARADVYLEVLDDVPCWAVESAARKWFRHEAGNDERGRPYDYRWAPDPGALRRIAMFETFTLKARATEMQRAIDARPFVDCSEQLARGQAAWHGLKLAIKMGTAKDITFEDAIELGSNGELKRADA